MITELLVGATKAKIGHIVFDASLSETHTESADVTQHPVEFGANITDHIRRQPAQVEINGLVTDHPIVFAASLAAPSPIDDDLDTASKRADLAYAYLQAVMEYGELVTVVTSLREYENMAIKSLVVTRDVNNGQVLNCSVGLIEVILAETQTATASAPTATSSKGAADKGKKPKKAATTKETETSDSIVIRAGKWVGGGS